MCSVYFDTPDEKLAKAGFSLRVRKSDQGYTQTVKWTDKKTPGIFNRQEFEISVRGFQPDLATLRGIIPPGHSKAIAKSLRRAFRVDVCRSEWTLAERKQWPSCDA